MFKIYKHSAGRIIVDSVSGNETEAKDRVDYLLRNNVSVWYVKVF